MVQEEKTQEGKTQEKEIAEAPKEPTSLVSEARAAAEEVRKVTSELREQLDRKERILAEEALGGKSEAGQEKEKKVDTPTEYVKKVMKGEIKLA